MQRIFFIFSLWGLISGSQALPPQDLDREQTLRIIQKDNPHPLPDTDLTIIWTRRNEEFRGTADEGGGKWDLDYIENFIRRHKNATITRRLTDKILTNAIKTYKENAPLRDIKFYIIYQVRNNHIAEEPEEDYIGEIFFYLSLRTYITKNAHA